MNLLKTLAATTRQVTQSVQRQLNKQGSQLYLREKERVRQQWNSVLQGSEQNVDVFIQRLQSLEPRIAVHAAPQNSPCGRQMVDYGWEAFTAFNPPHPRRTLIYPAEQAKNLFILAHEGRHGLQVGGHFVPDVSILKAAWQKLRKQPIDWQHRTFLETLNLQCIQLSQKQITTTDILKDMQQGLSALSAPQLRALRKACLMERDAYHAGLFHKSALSASVDQVSDSQYMVSFYKVLGIRASRELKRRALMARLRQMQG